MVFPTFSCEVFCTFEVPACQNSWANPDHFSYISLLCRNIDNYKIRNRLQHLLHCVSVPENPPVNVTAVLNGTEVLMAWEEPPGKLNGELQGYMVEYKTPAAQQVSLGHVKSQTKAGFTKLKDPFVLACSVDSFMWIPDWKRSCQSTCRPHCPMCPSGFAPTLGRGGAPGPPHRR